MDKETWAGLLDVSQLGYRPQGTQGAASEGRLWAFRQPNGVHSAGIGAQEKAGIVELGGGAFLGEGTDVQRSGRAYTP